MCSDDWNAYLHEKPSHKPKRTRSGTWGYYSFSAKVNPHTAKTKKNDLSNAIGEKKAVKKKMKKKRV